MRRVSFASGTIEIASLVDAALALHAASSRPARLRALVATGAFGEGSR